MCGSGIERIFVAIIGLIFIISGVATLLPSIEKNDTYTETMGTIIGAYDCGSNGDTGPIIEYMVDGNTYIIESSICGSALAVGIEIRVLYDPDNPQEGVGGSFVELWMAPILCLLVGIPMCCCSSVLLCTAPTFVDGPMAANA